MKKISVILTLFFVLVLASSVSAEESAGIGGATTSTSAEFAVSTSTASADSAVATSTDTEQEKENTKTKKEIRKNIGQQIRDIKKDAKQEIKSVVGEIKSELKTKIEEKKTELKEKLSKIKDEKKKKIIERVDDQLDKLNKKMTEHFYNVLDRLSKILDNINNRAEKAKANGRDVSVVSAAITEARNAIATSSSTIAVQAAKTYSMAISSEDTLKNDVGAARKSLHSDLVKVRDTVMSAREAVKKAAVALAQILDADDDSEVEENTTSTGASGR